MPRRTFDVLATVAGLVIAAVLLTGGGLAIWGHSVVTSDVSSQLAAQKIVFPAKGSPELTSLPTADDAAMSQYAGQAMTTGAQARVWADNFIAVHLSEIGGGKTYSQLSTLAMKSPANAALQAQVQTVFRGDTLRSMLLNAYGFWQAGQILLIAAWAAFIAAIAFLVLSALGGYHVRRAAPEAELFPKLTAPGPTVQVKAAEGA